MSERSNENDASDEQECGFVYDHDTETTHEDETGIYWFCRSCGAEGFPDDDTWPDGVIPPGSTSDE